MLIRSTWTLSVAQPTVLRRSYHLELVKELHRRMGWEMAGNQTPVVAFSGLVGYCSTSKEFCTFQPEEAYRLSLCGLNEMAAKAIADLELSDTLEFLGSEFTVSDREDEISSYEQLYTTLVANEPEPLRKFNLQFTTPTAFSQQQIYLPLPVPTLMFQSWLTRWNEFAPVYLGSDELIAYLSQAVVLPKHKIKTRLFHLHRNFISGFIGEVNLNVRSRADPLLANVAHLLLRYAEFCGTGIKTRLGMGQTLVNE
ncbi:CRISPR system precrRNA processing endoribonuclease RAMP protein Cas6 [Phormidium sp. CCY1219]|uniref:CRISPR system precrRNA processing endoribonuclease RAMP protein Cas6 n=1 Tax=Phormidium sp. CCY1219 TaxID=2886104 RepID=UPI002D1EFA55|nr:CRISPR system precrRNA processing endoribonuclease RAMP protein Cas6 [Phormidium sp. CCY1219]MEB3830200.1 CRISPR system precrRNA processing endoribonuclease RAMP protein Cas6 [Phormidium sp. CCY1219]